MPEDDKKNPISTSRKAWGFVLGGMIVVALVNVVVGVMSFPFEAQERERQRVREAEQTDAATIRPKPDAAVDHNKPNYLPANPD